MTKRELDEFDELMGRVHVGDPDAAEELVRRFEPEIRREVRIRLTDPRLRRIVDSMDICQSVLGNFFVRAALGQFEIGHPDQLFRLLATMARNKVIDRHRTELVRRRAIDDYRPDGSYDLSGEPLDKSERPEMIAEGEELLVAAFGKLSPEEKQITEFRKAGLSWNEIAEKIGSNAQALRKRLSRACDRILRELTTSE